MKAGVKWTGVDCYIADTLLSPGAVLKAALRTSADAGHYGTFVREYWGSGGGAGRAMMRRRTVVATDKLNAAFAPASNAITGMGVLGFCGGRDTRRELS